MADRKTGGGQQPDAKGEASGDIKTDASAKIERDSFVHTFFKKGAEFTDELLRENDRLRKRLFDLESENAALRTHLASDEAIRELLRKIEYLEREKEQLLSHVREAERNSSHLFTRYSEVEEELSNLAHLYVASYQLHSTLHLREVLRHLKELLTQLVGSRAHAFYLKDGSDLVPISSDGIELSRLPRLAIHAGSRKEEDRGSRDRTGDLIERVFMTGVAHIEEGELSTAPRDQPAACVPMRIDDAVVGVIVIYSLLDQKEQFLPVDYALFKMLGAHAATALMGALLFANSNGKFPGLEAIDAITRNVGDDLK
ncbi:GAF domain-containing protein [Pendulispora brunnea]|uniref:GAF domain-containing protein n=1 Tax=Pendulispora brunnea TaxID=2905690 RepID=A0ABZ2KLD2_9BACT